MRRRPTGDMTAVAVVACTRCAAAPVVPGVHAWKHVYRCCVQGMMKTDDGRKLAQGRHEFMESYLQQFYAEWEGSA